MQIIKGKQSIRTRVVLYGIAGIGKSTFASKFPKPLFLDLEKGTAQLDCDRLIPANYAEFIESCKLFKESDYQTLIIDTIDILETFISAKICNQNQVPTIESMDFGKGYAAMAQEWVKLLDSFDSLNRNIILICHEKIKLCKDLESGNEYDKYFLKMHEKSASYIVSRADAVLFCKWESAINAKKGIAINTGLRVAVTQENGNCVAKNRFNLQPIEELNDKLIEKLIK